VMTTVAVLSGPERRRRWTSAEKRKRSSSPTLPAAG
jgi:hypothetical protein